MGGVIGSSAGPVISSKGGDGNKGVPPRAAELESATILEGGLTPEANDEIHQIYEEGNNNRKLGLKDLLRRVYGQGTER